IAERERVSVALSEAGATVFPSQANFILVRVADATAVWEGLRARGVLVKCFDKPKTPLEGCLRITIGTPAENNELLTAWNEVTPRPAPKATEADLPSPAVEN